MGTAVVHRISLEHGWLTALGPNEPVGVALAAGPARGRGGAPAPEPGSSLRPGSGKTRVLTERARLLLRGWGLPPDAVALVAYNVRAANEMRERLGDVGDVRIRTLNALGLRLCGRTSTIEEMEVQAAPRWPGHVSQAGRDRPGGALDRGARAGPANGTGRSPRRSRARCPTCPISTGWPAPTGRQLAERGVVDFDEQVTGAIERLLADPVYRHRMQRFARVLLVDEFQDLTPAHMLLIRLLTGPAGAVFGVGDDDQTIYGYAGATPRWLVDFGSWFPGASMHPLEVNYRCPAPVVAAASNLLTRNALRVDKVIRAADSAGRAESLSVVIGEEGPATQGPVAGCGSSWPGGRRPAT
jgi:DNA helicase-2/ATP-dependent DNA helicase PcrA